MRKLSRILAALALPVLAGGAVADEQAIRLAPAEAQVGRVNQQLANEVAAALRTSGRLASYAIDVQAEGGVVTLAGSVSNSDQKSAALNVARRLAGVVSVEDRLVSRTGATVIPVNFEMQAPPPGARPVPPGAMPVHSHAAPGAVPEPAPSHAFPGGLAPYSDTPVVPPYAWPAYTPYNNYASMAYQTQYPSGAWPFIGPPHPYPMIPSGWRSVTLRWKRGYWFLHFNAF